MRKMTNEEATKTVNIICDGIRNVIRTQFIVLNDNGLDPFEVRYAVLTALTVNAGDIIGASADPQDREEMREFMKVGAQDLLYVTSEGLAATAERNHRRKHAPVNDEDGGQS